MASGLEIIGGLSAVFSLIGQFNSLNARLKRCVRALKYAREDVNQIFKETTDFENILDLFHATMKKAILGDRFLQEMKQKRLVDNLVRACRNILSRIQAILHKVAPLRDDRPSLWWDEKLARLKWAFAHDDVDLLHATLEKSKSGLILLVTVVQLWILTEYVCNKGAADEAVKQELMTTISRYKKRIKTLEARCRAAERRCEELQHPSRAEPASDMVHGQADLARIVQDLAKVAIEEARQIEGNRWSARLFPEPIVPVNRDLPRERPTSPTTNKLTGHSVPHDGDSLSGSPMSGPEHQEIVVKEASPSTSQNHPNGYTWVPADGLGLPIPGPRLPAPRSSTPDPPIGPIIVDCNDGRGVREEHRRPRKPRHVTEEKPPASSSSSGTSPSGPSGWWNSHNTRSPK